MWGALRRVFETIGADPTDDAELRLQKRVLVAIERPVRFSGCSPHRKDQP
jgi:hypothetical protein